MAESRLAPPRAPHPERLDSAPFNTTSASSLGLPMQQSVSFRLPARARYGPNTELKVRQGHLISHLQTQHELVWTSS